MKFRPAVTFLALTAIACGSGAFAAVPVTHHAPVAAKKPVAPTAIRRPAVKKAPARPVTSAKPVVKPAAKPAAEAFNPKPEIINGLPWYKPVEGFKLAEKLHKPVMVDMYTDWCGWCKIMDRVTFPDPAVSKILTQNYVLVKADAEDGAAGTEIAMAVGIQSFPTCLFFNWKREAVAAIIGFRKPEVFAAMLQEALAINSKFKVGMRPVEIAPPDVSTVTIEQPTVTTPASTETQPVPVTPSTATP